jgi:type II secretory ATPase GspE/PulE/Tfp pilus assembly ATPase PilB-like protein
MEREDNCPPHFEATHVATCISLVTEELEKGTTLSIIRLVECLIEHAHAVRASDIHLDPSLTAVTVRLRVDGVLTDVHTLPLRIHNEVISRLKILCGLRTDEHQSAQDGRFELALSHGLSVDVRVSIVPTYYGENAVLRLLSSEAFSFTLETLGFTQANIEKITSAIAKPYGMILATGPTGSGKTTTLYTLINMLNTKDTSIITIEDPIEYAIEGINQIQVNPRTGLTFAQGLRSMLRQDPNTIMVGEIRDTETAKLAVNISLTGHLIFSTLHTNDTATTLPRLLDMQVEPYLIASTITIAIGQRLLRRLCPVCKKEKTLTSVEIASFDGFIRTNVLTTGARVCIPVGCIDCNHTGYKSRIGVYEVLTMSNSLRDAVLRRATAHELRELAINEGMTPIVEDACSKVLQKFTSLEEVLTMRYE